MATVLFDTLKAFETLKSSGFSEEQAKGLSDTIKAAQESSAESLATKGDIKDLKSDIETLRLTAKADIESAKSDIIKWVAAMLVAQASLMAVMFKLLGLIK